MVKVVSFDNLEESTPQEVFDWVVTNLTAQGKKSVAELDGMQTCAYRGADGSKCAAGWLMSDEDYHKSYENEAWSQLVDRQRVPAVHADLISRLQHVHDNHAPEFWRDRFKGLAYDFGLSDKVLDSHQ